MNSTSLFYPLDSSTYANEQKSLDELITLVGLSEQARQAISARGAALVEEIRQQKSPALMDVFLAEYGLSTDEGVALMCLAEALLRVPDAKTMDALIEDKIVPSNWSSHLGQSSSSLVNASTWGLLLTAKVLNDYQPGVVGHIRHAIKRLGEPVIRSAVNLAMKEMGRQFVLGQTIESAIKRASKLEKKGYSYSYDMLGEAAKTETDAQRHLQAYVEAIRAVSSECTAASTRENPAISLKLSALFPRYEVAQRTRVLNELVPRLTSLALLAKEAGIGLTVDAEEADRLFLSLEVFEQVLANPELADWDGFGVVVQTYSQRAGVVIDTLYQLVTQLDRHISVRLVKGAYWDAEVKLAQVKGMTDFPVFTSKAASDVSYIANAKRLLSMTDRFYPQFATHNAHTVATILHLAEDNNAYEFQRLHGMGEQLFNVVKAQEEVHCRIYAPVGAHKDLLAYLVRRLLENGANSSFVNQMADENVKPEVVAADPFTRLIGDSQFNNLAVGSELFSPQRPNSKGWDLTHLPTLEAIEEARSPFHQAQWQAEPLLADKKTTSTAVVKLTNPANADDVLGQAVFANQADVEVAVNSAQPWSAEVTERAKILNRVADLYEQNFGELFALLCREAGKTLPDAVAEVREAVDFLRYYAANAIQAEAVGHFVCISPWNFPLAIFTGQISAALAAGNAVLAKPAEQAPLIAYRAVQLMHEAGVPVASMQLLIGGGDVGAMLTAQPKVQGVTFTGSTETAQSIRRNMAENLSPGAPLIAETGGLNAMIVDSTALLEQAVSAVIESAFQSAGQRCSALRCLYVQADILDEFTEMLFGAMAELTLGDPWQLSTDIGPVIDAEALANIESAVDKAEQQGRLLKLMPSSDQGTFIGPAVIRVDSISDIEKEIFGPVLHIASFKNHQLAQVVDDINATGYGLTFGVQTRIDNRVQWLSEHIEAGNIYVNRNQIGAIVGSQPFGGHGLSGTGPKAGGPNYLKRFYRNAVAETAATELPKKTAQSTEALAELQQKIDQATAETFITPMTLPGPTGESNCLSFVAKPAVLCLGPSVELAEQQAQQVRQCGGKAVVCAGLIYSEQLQKLAGFSAVIWWGDATQAQQLEKALAAMQGALRPLIIGQPDIAHVAYERHVCIDTTASGGNTELLAGG
ncbi:bifunctional proline dehydrogenase/L-glutamate gamma-semialdehyde dehydrogenase PutA [Reinekea thalattae]|uniref:Bifunctional protein PutA n=1 Tax=Reinekea thalattae TaxID=2593301 RepID=A0A5C8ZCJ3_9GAMM|nr:bifunctional proline dehydrogenase/L-glutamate gamma-semialdehyde dehydrogenase PutA [Reinekea thalattae]TXR54636.1 bifunctional proline dehydrogenase/L-glutamate gamma-semialdehyde dehydrogenase PutA [Reinekea thalattae]